MDKTRQVNGFMVHSQTKGGTYVKSIKEKQKKDIQFFVQYIYSDKSYNSFCKQG